MPQKVLTVSSSSLVNPRSHILVVYSYFEVSLRLVEEVGLRVFLDLMDLDYFLVESKIFSALMSL